MNKAEAKSLLASELHALAGRSLDELAAMNAHNEVETVIGESGANYQIELNVFRNSTPGENLRIMGSIDDGGWRAFLPLTDSLIMKPDGTLV
jgi:hypothetical protein